MDLGQIPMSPALAASLTRASEAAAALYFSQVTLEHLLLALCDDPDAVAVLDASRVAIGRLKTDVIGFLNDTRPPNFVPSPHLAVSGDVSRILEAASAAARGGRRRDISGAIVLAAIVGDARSAAAQMLQAQGLTFNEAIRALQRATLPPVMREPQISMPPAEDVLARARERVQSRAAPSLRQLLSDLPRPPPPPPLPSESFSSDVGGNVGVGTTNASADGMPSLSAPQPSVSPILRASEAPLAQTNVAAPSIGFGPSFAEAMIAMVDDVFASERERAKPPLTTEPLNGGVASNDHDNASLASPETLTHVDDAVAPMTASLESVATPIGPSMDEPVADATPIDVDVTAAQAGLASVGRERPLTLEPGTPEAAISGRVSSDPRDAPDDFILNPFQHRLALDPALSSGQDAAPQWQMPQAELPSTGGPFSEAAAAPVVMPKRLGSGGEASWTDVAGSDLVSAAAAIHRPGFIQPPPIPAAEGRSATMPAPMPSYAGPRFEPPFSGTASQPGSLLPLSWPNPSGSASPARPPGSFEPGGRFPPMTDAVDAGIALRSAEPTLSNVEHGDVYQQQRGPLFNRLGSGQALPSAPQWPMASSGHPNAPPLTNSGLNAGLNAGPNAGLNVGPNFQPPFRTAGETRSSMLREPEFHSPPSDRTIAPPPSPAAPVEVASGEMTENIPRTMRVAVPQRVEIRIAKQSIAAIAREFEGGGSVWQHGISVTQAMSIRLRAPDGGFFIETVSPETQWIESRLGFNDEDFASWRFVVTPQTRGRARLQIVVSARTTAADGIAAEAALPDQVVEVRVRSNVKQTLGQWVGWIAAAVIGGVLARFGEGGLDAAKALLSRYVN